MSTKVYFIVATICAAIGCSVIVTCMLLPSWLTGCESIRNGLNATTLIPSKHSDSNENDSELDTTEFPSLTTVRTKRLSDVITTNASKFSFDKFCVKQAIFILYVEIAGHSTSLRLIVSKDPTLTVVTSINLIISIICSAFAFFALVTALSANVHEADEIERAQRNSIIGMSLLILAGILSIGGMCSYTVGSQDLPFDEFDTRMVGAIRSTFSVNNVDETSLTLNSKDQEFLAKLLRELSYNVKYSYAWYLGWIGTVSLCISAIFSIIARRQLLTKPGQYTSLRTIRI